MAALILTFLFPFPFSLPFPLSGPLCHLGRFACEERDAIPECGEALIVGLALRVAIEDLLNNDSDLEEGEGFVESNRGEIAADRAAYRSGFRCG
jgi:hypothetical protein